MKHVLYCGVIIKDPIQYGRCGGIRRSMLFPQLFLRHVDYQRCICLKIDVRFCNMIAQSLNDCVR